jgi:hypothetical protein
VQKGDETRNAHAGIDLLPPVERRFSNVHLAADLAHRCSTIRLPQGKCDLLV